MNVSQKDEGRFVIHLVLFINIFKQYICTKYSYNLSLMSYYFHLMYVCVCLCVCGGGVTVWKWFCSTLICIWCFLNYSTSNLKVTPTSIPIPRDVIILNILGLCYCSWFSHAVSPQNEQGNHHLGLEALNIWVPLYTLRSAAWLVHSCGVLWMVTCHRYLIERRMTDQSVKQTNYACQP